MKAHLHSVRIAPKKANLIAMMVRGMHVKSALIALSRTNKKGARMVEELIKSAVANAQHNDKQHREHLMIKSIIVNQGTAYRRGVPMARGRMRPMNKFMSHISVVLGIADGDEGIAKKTKKTKNATKDDHKPSQSSKNTVQKPSSKKEKSSSEDSASTSANS